MVVMVPTAVVCSVGAHMPQPGMPVAQFIDAVSDATPMPMLMHMPPAQQQPQQHTVGQCRRCHRRPQYMRPADCSIRNNSATAAAAAAQQQQQDRSRTVVTALVSSAAAAVSCREERERERVCVCVCVCVCVRNRGVDV